MNSPKRAIQRRLQILASAYPWLIREESRNLAFWRIQPPKLAPPRKVDDWLIFSLPDREYYWPQEFNPQNLPGLYKEIFTPWQQNPHAYETPRITLQPGDWVLDAGACEGFFCAYALQRGASVLALEPVERLAQALRLTFAAEAQAGRMRVLCAGLAEDCGQATLRVAPEHAYTSTLEKVSAEMDAHLAPGLRVEHISVDGLIEQGILPRLDFLKMDIEGWEVAAMRGALQTLQTQRPKLSLAVYHQPENARVISQMLHTAGLPYRLWQHGVFLRQGQGPARPFMLHGACP